MPTQAHILHLLEGIADTQDPRIDSLSKQLQGHFQCLWRPLPEGSLKGWLFAGNVD